MKGDKQSRPVRSALALGVLGLLAWASGPADAAVRIEGRVEAGGGAVGGSTVTLWAASAGDPKQLAQTKSADDGGFPLSADETSGSGASLYLIAKGGVASVNKGSGDNPSLAFLAVLGGMPPAKVVVNEMTTVASVWTNAQFLNGAAIKGPALGLKIAAGNVPNFVDLCDRRLGRDNSGPAQQRPDADDGQFRHAGGHARGLRRARDSQCLRLTVPGDRAAHWRAPTDTLTAAESIARYPWYRPDALRPARPVLSSSSGKNMRAVPFMPYLNLAPSAWVVPLKFDGGGYRAGGKAMFDSEGNLWVGDNFTVGWQGQDFAVARQCHEVRPKRQAIVADHDRFCRRRDGGGHLWRSRRRQRQRLVHLLWRPFDLGLRQERQAADAAGRHHIRRPARADAGHHRHAERRRVGARGLEEPTDLFPEG